MDAGTRVLGFGFATPYLGAIRGAERVLAFMPAGQGVIDWPAGNGSSTALVEEDSLPLPDSSMDLAILVHALEMSAHPNSLMAELRRVLTGTGGSSSSCRTGRGRGRAPTFRRSASAGPIRAASCAASSRKRGSRRRRWRTALHMPPATSRPMLGAAGPLDSIGRIVWPAFAGVIVVSAVKRNVQGLGVRIRPRLAPALRPAFRPNVGVAGRLPP